MIIIKYCPTILIRFANVTCWSTEDLLEILSPRKSSCCNSALASCSIVSSTLASESARSLCPLRMAATVIISQHESSSHLPTLPGAKGLPHRATWWRSWRSMVPGTWRRPPPSNSTKKVRNKPISQSFHEYYIWVSTCPIGARCLKCCGMLIPWPTKKVMAFKMFWDCACWKSGVDWTAENRLWCHEPPRNMQHNLRFSCWRWRFCLWRGAVLRSPAGSSAQSK